MDRGALNFYLELWADYIRGGRSLHAPGKSILAGWMEYKGAPPRRGYNSKPPAIADESFPAIIDSQVNRLHRDNPMCAKILRTEYGLTRYYDTRGQAYRAAKLGVALRTYQLKLKQARERMMELLEAVLAKIG